MEEHSEYREELHGEHPHAYDHTEPSYTIVAILGGITVVALIVVGIGIQIYYENTEQGLIQSKVLSQPSWSLDDLRRKEAWELTHYQYMDKSKGTVRMPLDKAMNMVMQESAANQMKYPTNAYAVKTGAELAASPGVSQAGAAAVQPSQNTGSSSSPNAQPTVPQQPNR